MARPPSVRWNGKTWVAEVGEEWISGGEEPRKRRREVKFDFGPHEREKALAAMLAYREQRRAVEADPSAALTVELVCDAFLRWSEENQPRRTYDGHREVVPKFVAWTVGDGTMLGELPARRIDAGHLRAFLDDMTRAGHAPNYVARMARSIKRAWSWAHALDRSRTTERLIPTNPLVEVKGPKVPRSPERYLERGMVEGFLRWVWRRAKADRLGWDASRRPAKVPLPSIRSRFDRLFVCLVRFAMISGCRPDEAARATWDGLDLDRGTITIRGKNTARTGKQRVIFLTPSLKRMLRAIQSLPGRHPEFVFTHKRGRFADARGASDPLAGEPYRDKSLQRKLAGLREEAKSAGVAVIDAGPSRLVLYGLRHTRISDDLMAGGDIASVAAIHNTSPRMIETTYGHLLTEHLARMNDDLARRGRKRK